jgi:hypothetical protein
LGFGGFKGNVGDFFVEVLLGIDIKIIMFFSFSKELLFEFVLALGKVLSVLEVLASEFVHEVDVFLEKVFYHDGWSDGVNSE